MIKYIKKIRDNYLKLTERERIFIRIVLLLIIPFIITIIPSKWTQLLENSTKKTQTYKEVRVSGLVNHQGVVRIKGNETLSKLIHNLGGVNSNFYLLNKFKNNPISNMLINNKIEITDLYVKKLYSSSILKKKLKQNGKKKSKSKRKRRY